MPGLWKRGTYRDTVIRRITDVPVVGNPLRLRVRMSRFRCTTTSCGREVFAHSTDRLARRGATTTRRCARYILGRLMCFRMTTGAFAREPPRPPARTACGSAKKADAVLRITLVISGGLVACL
jgi:transposase